MLHQNNYPMLSLAAIKAGVKEPKLLYLVKEVRSDGFTDQLSIKVGQRLVRDDIEEVVNMEEFQYPCDLEYTPDTERLCFDWAVGEIKGYKKRLLDVTPEGE